MVATIPAVVIALSIAPSALGQASTVKVVPEAPSSSSSNSGSSDPNIVRATSADPASSTGAATSGASTTVVVTGEPVAPPPPPPPPPTAPAAPAAPDPSQPTLPAFVLDVEQAIPIAPPEWELLELRQLESRMVNAPNDASRAEAAAAFELLRARLESDGPVVILGRRAGGGNGNVPAAVLVPSGLGGRAMASASRLRVTPLDAPFPASALGKATRAFPNLRLFGTASAPGYIAAHIESASGPTSATPTPAGAAPSPWARRAALSLPESEQLAVDGSPEAGPLMNGRVPLAVTVRNAGTSALPPCEVFFEFMDASGNLIHREFLWITRQRTEALEASLPALVPGDRVVIETPVPPEIAAQAQSCRVFIVKMLPGAQAARR